MNKKTILKVTTVVYALFFAGFISSCKNNNKHEVKPVEKEIPVGTFCYKDEGRTAEMLNYTELVKMLTEYDTTRKIPLEKALGYEDTRINNFNFNQFKKYLGYVESLSDKANIKITGISFISGAKANYNSTGKSYQDLIYVPTTTIDGEQVAFDPVQSVKQGRLVTLKEMLKKFNYNWPYDKISEKENQTKLQKATTLRGGDEVSGAGNRGELKPPY